MPNLVVVTRIGDYMNPEQLQEFLYRRAPEREEQRLTEVCEYLARQGKELFERYGVKPIGGGSTALAYDVTTATVFSMATGAKTALLAISPSGHGLSMVEFGVAFDGVTSSAVPALIDIVSSTQATAGTSGVTPTITQVRGRSTSGQAPTGGSNYTAEPTVLTRLKVFYIPQYNGTYTYQFALGREIEIDSSGGTAKAFGIRGNTTATVNFVGWVEVEAL